MRRVLYFTGYRMVAQEWSGRLLASSVYFEPDDQGLDLFAAYLRSFQSEPVRMLVDLIEEEFRQIRIPLLRGSDRQAILKRNYAKYFRTSEYKFAISQSIEKGARKEERLLLIGLTNQYLLEPWLKIIQETKTPLSGIISLPLLAEQFVRKISYENKAVILVSQQVPSNLRQSVFIDGKLILSRLVPIASFYQGDYATDVMRDIDSTHRYLISQRIVERTESMSIQILTNKRHFDKLTARCEEETQYNFQILDINQLLERDKIEVPDEQDFSSALYCYLASKKLSANHYALPKQRQYFQLHRVSLGLKAASLALVAVGIGLATTSGVKGLLYDSTIVETVQIEQKYKAKFNQLSESRIDSTTSTSNMQHIVQAVEKIENKFLIDPESMFALISRDMSIFSDIRVKKIDWFVSNISSSLKHDEVVWGKAKKRKKRKSEKRDKNLPKPKKGFFEIANVDAEFLNFDGNFRYALSAVDDLEKSMSESGNYFSVQVTKRPLDIEPENRLSGNAGAVRDSRQVKAEIGLRLVREVKRDE